MARSIRSTAYCLIMGCGLAAGFAPGLAAEQSQDTKELKIPPPPPPPEEVAPEVERLRKLGVIERDYMRLPRRDPYWDDTWTFIDDEHERGLDAKVVLRVRIVYTFESDCPVLDGRPRDQSSRKVRARAAYADILSVEKGVLKGETVKICPEDSGTPFGEGFTGLAYSIPRAGLDDR